MQPTSVSLRDARPCAGDGSERWCAHWGGESGPHVARRPPLWFRSAAGVYAAAAAAAVGRCYFLSLNFLNKEICFISSPGNGRSCCCCCCCCLTAMMEQRLLEEVGPSEPDKRTTVEMEEQSRGHIPPEPD